MVAFVIVIVIVAAALQYYTVRRGFSGIEYQIYPSLATVEPDEVFEIVTELHNHTRRFIPFIGMQEPLPPDIQIHSTGVTMRTNSFGQGTSQMTASVYLMPRQRLVRRVKASLPQRGRYFFRGATLGIGDFLGLSESYETFGRFGEIVVIPRLFPLEPVAETLGGFLGDISVNRFILEDPVLTLGFREYTMREPMKSISWTQSARTGQLMVKKYDYTLELTVTVLLNVQCPQMIQNIARIENCFSVSRTVCEMLEEKGIQYDFITNAHAAGAISLWGSLGEGLGAKHLTTILEGLGRATYSFTESFDSILHKVALRAQQGRSYIIITPQVTDSLERGVQRLRDLSGGQCRVISAAQLEE